MVESIRSGEVDMETTVGIHSTNTRIAKSIGVRVKSYGIFYIALGH